MSAVRNVSAVVISVICFVLFILTAVLPLYTYTGSNLDVHVNYFEACVEYSSGTVCTSSTPSNYCDDWHHAYKSGRACCIVAIVLVGLWAACFALIRVCGCVNFRSLSCIGPYVNTLQLFVLGFACFFSLALMAIGYIVFYVEICDARVSDLSNATVDVGIISATIGAFFILVQFMAELCSSNEE